MARTKRIAGVKETIKAMKNVALRHAKGAEQGIKKATLFLLSKSQAIVPVEFGVLRGSGYARVEGKGFSAEGQVGYTADYAVIVHEDLEARHGQDYNDWYGEEIAAGTKTPRRPEEQAKFLEQPARVNRKEMADIVKEEMKP